MEPYKMEVNQIIPVVVAILIIGGLSLLIIKYLVGKKNKSYVRNWAKEQEIRLRNAKSAPAIDFLFSAMIYGASVIWEPRKEMKGFSGDSTIFEAACYLLFEINLWLYTNKPEYKSDIIICLHQETAKLFSFALKIDQRKIVELINDRLHLYVETNNTKDFLDLLTEFIIRTKHNAIPQKYDEYKYNRKIDETRLNAFLYMQIRMIVGEFIIHMAPSMIQSVKNLLKILEKPDS